jgi:hypothetical protein
MPLPPRRHVSVPGAGAWLWVAGAAAVAAIAVALGVTQVGGGGSSTPARTVPAVAPIAPGGTPADEARSLGRWLRRYSR